MDGQKDKLFRLFKLLKLGFGEYKWQIVALAIFSFVGGILEGIGVTAIIPLFSLIDKNQPETADIISKTIRRLFLYIHPDHVVKYLLVLIAALFVFKAFLLFINQFITVRITTDYQKKTRGELLKLILQTNWSYLIKQKLGYVDQILVQNVNDSSTFLVRISSGLLVATNLIIYSLLVINTSLGVAIFALVFGAFALFIFKPLFYRVRVVSHQMVQKIKNLAHYLNEYIIGAKSIKSASVEGSVLEICLGYFNDIRNLQIKVGLLSGLNQVLFQPIGIFFIIGAFAVSYKTSAFNFASFAVSVFAINKVFANIQSVQSEIYGWNAGLPSLLSVLKFREEVLRNQEENIGRKKFSFIHGLEFKNVMFAYDRDNRDAVISKANFSIKKGQIVGLIGSSGAGKTTIVDLLLRLFQPLEGMIAVDGVSISDISLKDWRTNIGYVSQDIFLINDTIFNNIKFYDDSLGLDQIVEAAKMAHIYEFVKSLPNQFETVVGERGTQLSGGQRQRIALARVLARTPAILILDEATSALDNESEVLIQKAISSLRGKITVIAIAHRLSTILDFDKVMVLGGGKIIEEGAPRELLKDANSQFYKIYNLKK